MDGTVEILPICLYIWYTRSVNKVMRLIQYNSVLTFKLQIELFPFKIVPLGGYTPPETLFPIFVATLVVANRNRFQLVGYSFFDVFHRPKMASFKVKLQFWEQKEVAWTQIRGVWGLWNHRNALFSQKFCHRDRRVMGRYRDGASNCQQCLVAREQLFFLVFQEFHGNKTD